MSLATPWTRGELRTAVRRELMDPNARWWSDAELNLYLDQWQERLQDELEFAIETATVTTSQSTIPFNASDYLRPRALYWNGFRLPVRSKQEMDNLEVRWREHEPGTPYAVWYEDGSTAHLWPTPIEAGEVVITYVTNGRFISDASPMVTPGWTRYSAAPFVCWRALSRFSPNTDINRALRRKVQFERALTTIHRIRDGFFPERFPTLKIASNYESNIIIPRPKALSEVSMPTIISLRLSDEIPTGTVDGANDTFTLAFTPNPSISLKVWVDGVLMTQGTHYTTSGNTILFNVPYIPITGQTIFASYRYTN